MPSGYYQSKNNWNKSEIEKLIKHYHEWNNEKLEKEIGRSFKAIKNKAYKLRKRGVKIKRHLVPYSCKKYKRISESNKGEKHWNYGKKTPDNVKRKISSSLKGRKKPEWWKEKIRQSHNNPKTKAHNRMRQLGKKSHRWGKSPTHGKGQWYKNKNGKKIWMRSTWEIKFALWLDENDLKWEYESRRFELIDRTYRPDFYVKDWRLLVEIKGWFHEKHQETIRQFRELYPKKKLIVLTKDILKDMAII